MAFQSNVKFFCGHPIYVYLYIFIHVYILYYNLFQSTSFRYPKPGDSNLFKSVDHFFIVQLALDWATRLKYDSTNKFHFLIN